MTGPFPGQGDIPQPWGGRPPEPPFGAGQPGADPQQPGYQGYGDVQWSDRQSDPAFPNPGNGGYDGGYGGGFDGPPPGRGRVVVIAVVALVVLAGAGTAIWYFAAGPGKSPSPRPVAATSNPPPLPTRQAVEPSGAAPDGAAAYDVGSCLDEQQGSGPGRVQLTPVPCGGDQAVFVINKVVDTATACDQGVQYHQHGYEVPDETANVAYCASLVVPANSCFVLGGTAPIARVPCGSDPNAVQVLAIETAPDADSACTDKTNPDVWFYQSPTSGQFACVSRPASTGTPSSGTPTSGAPTSGAGATTAPPSSSTSAG
jgi:hypothetical protein